MDSGTLNPQNAASYNGKTDSGIKLPFLKPVEKHDLWLQFGIVLLLCFMFFRQLIFAYFGGLDFCDLYIERESERERPLDL